MSLVVVDDTWLCTFWEVNGLCKNKCLSLIDHMLRQRIVSIISLLDGVVSS